MRDHTAGQLPQIWAPSARTQWHRLYIYIFSLLCLLPCSGIFLSYQNRFSQFWPRPLYPSMIHFRFFFEHLIFFYFYPGFESRIYIYIYIHCSAEVKSGLRCIQWRIWWNPRFSYLFSQPHPPLPVCESWFSSFQGPVVWKFFSLRMDFLRARTAIRVVNPRHSLSLSLLSFCFQG